MIGEQIVNKISIEAWAHLLAYNQEALSIV